MMAGDVIWIVIERGSKEIVGVWSDYDDIPNRYVKPCDPTYIVYETKLR